jgi:hypothetical protein
VEGEAGETRREIFVGHRTDPSGCGPAALRERARTHISSAPAC